jgi:hypothetical protein
MASGLQGIANLGSSRGLIYLPYGDVALFGLSCAQIVRNDSHICPPPFVLFMMLFRSGPLIHDYVSAVRLYRRSISGILQEHKEWDLITGLSQNHPTTLPPSYVKWIANVCRTSTDGLELHRSAVRTGRWPLWTVEKSLLRQDLGPGNRRRLERMLENAKRGDFGIPYIPWYKRPRSSPCPPTRGSVH